MTDINQEKEQLFPVDKKDFDQLYRLADALLETRAKESHEYIMAKALTERLDQAIEDDEESVIFSEKEVEMLSEVV